MFVDSMSLKAVAGDVKEMRWGLGLEMLRR